MRQKILSALITSAVLTFCLTGCQGDVGTIQPETPAAETSAAETEARYRKELNEAGELCLIDTQTKETIPPFPEGWSGERISELVTIDGYQLTLPCKVSDILELSEDFRLDDPFDYNDGTSGYQIWYKDVIAAGGVFDNASNMILTINVGGNEYTKFEDIDSTIPEDVFLLFNDLPKDSGNAISVKYFQDNVRYGLQYFGRGKILLVWEEI